MRAFLWLHHFVCVCSFVRSVVLVTSLDQLGTRQYFKVHRSDHCTSHNTPRARRREPRRPRAQVELPRLLPRGGRRGQVAARRRPRARAQRVRPRLQRARVVHRQRGRHLRRVRNHYHYHYYHCFRTLDSSTIYGNLSRQRIRMCTVLVCSGIGVGIYATNNPEACAWVLEDSRCQVAIVENAAQLAKIAAVAPDLQHTRLLAIVLYTGPRVEPPVNADKLPPIYTVRLICISRLVGAVVRGFTEAGVRSLVERVHGARQGEGCERRGAHRAPQAAGAQQVLRAHLHEWDHGKCKSTGSCNY